MSIFLRYKQMRWVSKNIFYYFFDNIYIVIIYYELLIVISIYDFKFKY